MKQYVLIGYIISSIIIVNLIVGYMLLYTFRESLIKEISINIEEYEELDLSHICDMVECTQISSKGETFTNSNYGYSSRARLVHIANSDPRLHSIKLLDNVYLTNRYEVVFIIDVRMLSGYAMIMVDSIFRLSSTYYILLVSFLSANAVFLLFNIYSYRKASARRYIELKHDSYNKSMMLITENIHHELNTPLAVINSKVTKLKGKVDSIISGKLTKEQCDIDSHHRDFEVITGSLTQIADLLERMHPFKDAKRENNRSMGDVIKTSCDMLSISQHDKFDYWVGEELYKYKVKDMRNGELTAVIINFIKNSIDANACNIQFRLVSLDKNKLTLYISDDGNGVPEALKCQIFKEDKSSKSDDRGSGLYTNRFLIEEAKGSVKLKYSSTNGTIFELILGVIEA